jgi:hypothetical protein
VNAASEASAEPVCEWLIDGTLVYRLTDHFRPQNRDEIRVTQADGSRLAEDCERRASTLLAMLNRYTAPPDHRAVMQQALEALELCDRMIRKEFTGSRSQMVHAMCNAAQPMQPAIKALRKALGERE